MPRARRDWGYGRDEQLTSDDLIAEKYRGIRPPRATPRSRTTRKSGPCSTCSTAEQNAGLMLTEHFAMHPAASVCGLYFAHPEARYFSVDRISAEQVASYAERKGMTVAEVERWLAPNLGYEPR